MILCLSKCNSDCHVQIGILRFTHSYSHWLFSFIHIHIDYNNDYPIYIYVLYLQIFRKNNNDTNNNSQVSNQGRVTWHLANRWRLRMDWRGHFDRPSARTLHETMGFNPEICIHKRFLVGFFSLNLGSSKILVSWESESSSVADTPLGIQL